MVAELCQSPAIGLSRFFKGVFSLSLAIRRSEVNSMVGWLLICFLAFGDHRVIV